MPIFDDEQELLEKFRDDASKMKLWTEYTPKGIENARYEIINGMVILIPFYNRKFVLLSSHLMFIINLIKNSENLEFLPNFDVKIDDNNIYIPKGVIYEPAKESSNSFVTKPIVIFEILTNVNKHILNAKFEHYQKMESLQEYVLVDLNNPQIWVYHRNNGWQVEKFIISQEFELKSIAEKIKVSELYHRVSFSKNTD